MKFTYKLFFSITALLTAAFMLFGSFMLFSYFNRMLERETEQGKPSELYNKNGIYARMVDLQSASGKWKIK